MKGGPIFSQKPVKKRPVENFKESLIHSFDREWLSYQHFLTEVKTKPSAVAVHQLRIATRRIEALLDLLRNFFPQLHSKKLKKRLCKMRNRFGSLRNAHVQLKSVENYPSYNLEPLEKAIKSCKKSEKRRVLKALRKMGPDSDNHLFEDVKKSISDQALKMTKNQAKLKLIAAIRSSLRDLSVSHQLDPKGFHKTRIAVKRIHYQEEILQKLLGVKFVNLWDLRRFQRLAGLIKDNRMFLKQLKHFHKKEDGIRKKDVKQLSITLAKDQNKYMSSNLKSFDSLKRGKWAP